jgi:hypothetical protein
MVFLGGSEEGRENARSRSAQSVFAGLHAFLNSPIFYVIYYILISGGFTTSSFRSS